MLQPQAALTLAFSGLVVYSYIVYKHGIIGFYCGWFWNGIDFAASRYEYIVFSCNVF